jgi:cytochrome P450
MQFAQKSSALPPSPKADWIGGHFRSFRKAPTEFLTGLSKLGDVSFFRMASQPAYFVNHPDLIRDVLVVNAHKFHKGRALQRAKALLGEGLLTSEDEFHLRQRRMIQPAFHKQQIAEYGRVMVDYTDRMADTWRDGETRNIHEDMMRLTLQIVGKTLFNADVEDEADEVGAAMKSFSDLFNFLLIPFSEWLQKLPLPHSKRFRHARDSLNTIVFDIINERRRLATDEGDLLSILLAARDETDGSAMSDEQIRDEALTLFLAGHETTAIALTWTLYLLSQNREVEAKLHEELNSLHTSPTFDDLPKLQYSEAVIAESMRLFPPAWVIGRLATEEHEIAGYRIPVGSLVLVSPYVLHHDARYWDAVNEFRPERWMSLGVKEAAQKGIYFPFGGGIRRCIGEGFAWTEGVLLLATIARRWKLRTAPDQKVGLSPMITLRPKHGMGMTLQKRKELRVYA